MSTAGELSGRGARLYREKPDKRDPHDFYVEPRWCVDLLLQKEPFAGTIVDPCCGLGTILECCLGPMFGADILPRSPWVKLTGDFLDVCHQNALVLLSGGRIDNVIFNPPFKLARPLVLEAVRLAEQKVAVLVPIKFLASEGRYLFFTRECQPTRIHLLSSRPSMPPGEPFELGLVEQKGGKVDYCWLVYDKLAPPRPPQMFWLSKRQHEALL